MSQTWELTGPHTDTVGGPEQPVRAVSMALVRGRVDIVADPELSGAVTYEVHSLSEHPIVASWDRDALRLNQQRDTRVGLLDQMKAFVSSGWSARADLTIHVPESTRITVTAAGADVLVAGTDADVSVNTGAGSVDLTRLDGRVTVRTAGGAVRASALTGQVNCTTGTGEVTLERSSVRSGRFTTVSGAVTVDLTDGASLLTASTVSGHVTVRLPAEAGYDVDAASTSGRVVIDGETLTTSGDDGKGGHRHAGDRAVVVKARTRSGDVTVTRSASRVQDVRPTDRA